MTLGGPADEPPGPRWDRRYAAQPWPSAPDDALVELAGALVPGRALDLGCGPGRNAIWLARRGWAVTGLDASPVGLAQAAARARDAGVHLELVQADVLDGTPAPGRYDLVVVANLHFPPGVREQFFAGAVAALAPGGHLYVTGRHLDAPASSGPASAERRYSEALLAELLAPLEVEARRILRPADGGGAPSVKVVAWAAAPARGSQKALRQNASRSTT